MPMCQAYGCTVRPGEGSKKSAFSIPNPLRDRDRCAQWLNNIGTDKFEIRTYKYNAKRVVCEDHFEEQIASSNIYRVDRVFAAQRAARPVVTLRHAKSCALHAGAKRARSLTCFMLI